MYSPPRSRSLLAILVAGVAIFSSGCQPEAMGFALPQGDVDRGAAAFVALECNACHKVEGIEWLGDGGEDPILVQLGGKVTRVQTYGQLVTSIINPSHKIALRYDQTTAEEGGKTSRMRLYNDVMTVQQMIDLVTFLQTKYDVHVPPSMYPIMP